MMAEGILTVNLPAKGKKWWKFTVCMLAGAFCGAGLGYTIGRYLKHSHKVSHVSASDIGALTLTAFYIGAAFLVLWFARDRMRLARVLEGKAAEVSASDEEVRSFRYQALVMAFAGILLAAPLLSVHLSSGSYVHRTVFVAGIVPLFAAQTFYNFRLWRISDEFVRSSMMATAAWTFAIGQGGLFLWSAAERMKLVKQASAWNLTVAMMLLYLLVGSVMSVRTARRE
jgi:hypothetical protein